MDFETKARIAGSHSKDENKTLDMVVNPKAGSIVFIVRNHNVEISNGNSIAAAISTYNDA